MGEPVLTRRELGRATLARQLLLERRDLAARSAIERLAGMQAQAPLAPYVGLWTRLRQFEAGELAELMRRRQVVRASLMRMTIHLVTARDALAWRPIIQRVAEGGFRGSQWSKQLGGHPPEAVVARAMQLLESNSLGRTEIGQILAAEFPGADPFALGGAVLYLVPTVQPTPRGVWGEGGVARLTTMPSWLGRDLDPSPSVEDLVVRCLRAFGPMTVLDVQAWSRLTRLREVFDRLGGRLRRFRGADGAELYDLPRAPRPAADTPAPARFLPEYDNLLLAHADRTRVNPDGRPVPLFPGNGAQLGTILVDGEHAGLWRLQRAKGKAAASGPVTVQVEPFRRLAAADRAELEAEGLGLGRFLAPEAARLDVRFARPA